MNIELKKQDYLLLILAYGVTSLLNAVEYYIQDGKLIEYLVDIPVSVITSFISILIFIYWLIPTFLIKKKNYFLLILLSLIVLVFFGAIDYISGFWSGGTDWSKFPKWNKFILISVFRTTSYSGFIFGMLLTKKFFEGQRDFFKIEKQQKENELKLLRSQIDPHFLFNNLNTLDSLIDSNAEKAKEYTNRLSLIYRYLIQTKDAEVMELSKELQFAENYIFLIETRFGNDYNFVIKKDLDIADKFIPTGALQALLENVVKHNKAQPNTSIKTTISINDNRLAIVNSKSEIRSKQESLGTGLENLKARYTLLSNKKIDIKNTAKKFEIHIPIIQLNTEN